MKWVVVGVLVGLVACANPNLDRAKRARYDVDPTLVYQGALEATQEKYAVLDGFPEERKIKTAWHQVTGGGIDEASANPRMSHPPVRVPAPQRPIFQRRLFARFDIRVVGERPYVVEVLGYASELRPGHALPTMLEGAARPGWIDERADGLRTAIYERLKKHAVLAPARRQRAVTGPGG